MAGVEDVATYLDLKPAELGGAAALGQVARRHRQGSGQDRRRAQGDDHRRRDQAARRCRDRRQADQGSGDEDPGRASPSTSTISSTARARPGGSATATAAGTVTSKDKKDSGSRRRRPPARPPTGHRRPARPERSCRGSPPPRRTPEGVSMRFPGCARQPLAQARRAVRAQADDREVAEARAEAGRRLDRVAHAVQALRAARRGSLRSARTRDTRAPARRST